MKADSMRKNKIDLTLEDNDEAEVGIVKTPKTSSTTISNKKVTKDYLKNRDPMKEFF